MNKGSNMTEAERKMHEETVAWANNQLLYLSKAEERLDNKKIFNGGYGLFSFFFWPTYIRTKMGLAHFYLGLLDICPDGKRFWPTFFGFWPTFIFKTGLAETQ